MKKGICKMTSLLAVAALSAACDGHVDFPDTAMKPCDILCTDGRVVPAADFGQSGKQAIAVVFHANHDENTEGDGYAVYLWDLSPVAFADSTGISQGTSADITALDGNGNTFAIYDTRETASPMAEAVFDLWRYGQSAYVPSVAQMRMLHAAKEQINPVIRMCGGDGLPDEADDCWYWTSTEVRGQETAKAWLYSVGNGAIQEPPKTQAHKMRPIITLNR